MDRQALAEQLVRDVSVYVAEQFRAGIGHERKDDGTVVTAADREAERRIRDGIRSAFPDDAIVGEEHENEHGTSGITWYIDPIDGTSNFATGIPFFGISLAYADSEGPLGCAIALPIFGSVYVAERGKGARKDGKAITVRQDAGEGRTPLFWLTYINRDDPRAAALYALVPRPRLRIVGSTVVALALYAEGAAHGIITFDQKPWDYAAGLLLAKEAGAAITGIFDSETSLPDVASFIATAPQHVDALKELVTKIS